MLLLYLSEKKLKGSPWITNEYLALSRDRDYHKRKFNKLKKQYNDTGQNGDISLKELWEKYKCLRNKANNLNKKLKKEYYHNKLQNCGNDNYEEIMENIERLTPKEEKG